MISSKNLKSILSSILSKNKEEHDKDINHLKTNMNKGWISSGTIEELHGISDTSAPFDYYSEEEQLIGQWIDGKPLYRKIIQLTETISLGNSRWVSTGYVMKDMIPISVRAIYYDNDGVNNTPPLAFYILDNVLQLMSYRDGTQLINPNHYLVIEYTKTTDTSIDKKEIVANGINMQLYDGTHYSEDELLIGQWIDGKPLYRKVYKLPTNFVIPANTWTSTGIPSTDKEIITNSIVLRVMYDEEETDCFTDVNVGQWNGTLQVIRNTTQLNLYKDSYIIVEYTKTIDTPFSVDEDIAWVALESDVNDVLNNIGE